MRSLYLAAFAVLLLTGCATAEQRAERQAAETARREASTKQWVDSMRAMIDETCAYAKADPIKYGDCRRQTVMFIQQQGMQQQQILMQQQAATDETYRQIFQSMKPRPQIQTNCTPVFGGGMSCTTQ